VPEAVHEVLDVLVDVGVVCDLLNPIVILVLGRQVAVDQEIGHLQVLECSQSCSMGMPRYSRTPSSPPM